MNPQTIVKKPTLRRALPAAALLAILITAGCSSSSTSPHGTGTPATAVTSGTSTAGPGGAPTGASAATISIKDFAYGGSGSVAAGSSVTVTNDDSAPHTVTADAGSAFDVTIQPGKTETFTAPSKAGTYPFHCTFHSNMHGTLTVTG